VAERTAAAERPESAPASEHEPRPAAIELVGVRREFGDRAALTGVDLRLEAGKTLAVLGPNGSGKTTLLRILAALLRPSAGRVAVLGCELPAEGWRLRGRIGFVGHEPLLYRDLTARENLRFAARLHALHHEDGEKRIETLLAAVAMEGRGDDRVSVLSAGMARRIDVCRAVLHDPELLLLDEPEVHLDATARELVAPLIGAADGRTRVLVSHDRDRAYAEAELLLELG
jgi:heme exporter protein A